METPKWLKWRQTGCGGSDVGALMGLNPYKTACDVYADKIADPPIEIPDNMAMFLGRVAEDGIAKFYEHVTGFTVKNDNKIRWHPKHRCLIANIDRVIHGNSSNGLGILEIKTTNYRSLKQWRAHGLPPYIEAQPLHYLNITGWKWADVIAVNLADRDFEIFPLLRKSKEVAIEVMEHMCLDFWEYVERRELPPVQTPDDIVKYKWDETAGTTIEATEAQLEAISRINVYKSAIKEATKNMDELTDRLKIEMDINEVLVSNGEKLATWKKQTQRRIDTAKVREAGLFEEYSKEIQFRKFNI